MNAAQQASRSLWLDDCAPEPLPPLDADLAADVAVVGAGMAGLSAAYELMRAGKRVAVIDAGPAGGGMTGRSTAHLSWAIDDRYFDLASLRGDAEARLAGESHRAAIDRIEAIAADEGIDCDFARLDGWLFRLSGDSEDTLQKEFDALRRLGFTDAVWRDRLPEAVADQGSALLFPRCGRVHPLKYLLGLLRTLKAGGAPLHQARAVSFDGDGRNAIIRTEQGRTLRAAQLIVATNSPVNERLTIHTKQAPYRTYVVALAAPRGAVPDALYWDTGDPYHYVRLQPRDGQDCLIVGGEDHKSGQADDAEARFARLEAWARERFRSLGTATHRWSGQVLEPVDDVAFIGRHSVDARNVFLATGDSGMGITHGAIAGMLLRDLALGRGNRWAKLYDPARATPKALTEFAKENLNVAGELLDYVRGSERDSAEALAPGEGATFGRGPGKQAICRTRDGTLHRLSAICTHVGCIVSWNRLEQCWDCPCHGSQFAPDGQVMNGPAVTALARAE